VGHQRPFIGREADVSCPSSAELRVRTPVLTFLYTFRTCTGKFFFTFGDSGIEYLEKGFFLVLASVDRLHSSRRSFKFSHLFRFCMMNIGTVRLFSSYWQRKVF